MINGIHHVSVVVSDLDKMAAFYCDAFGFHSTTSLDWPRGTKQVDDIIGVPNSSGKMQMLRAPNLLLELFQYLSPEGQRTDTREPWRLGYTHFCVDVTDIDAEYARLIKLGMTFHAPPPPRGKIDVRAIYGRDPEGNIIEIQELFSSTSPYYLETVGKCANAASSVMGSAVGRRSE